jgi:class 3 adenylate cyclase
MVSAPTAVRAFATGGTTSAPVAERRLVTVLFADLVGFTAASAIQGLARPGGV